MEFQPSEEKYLPELKPEVLVLNKAPNFGQLNQLTAGLLERLPSAKYRFHNFAVLPNEMAHY
jgi:hypothetical protein